MWSTISRSAVMLALVLGLLPAVSQAQLGGLTEPGSVTGMGTTQLKNKPSLLRLTIQLQEKAPSVAEALAKLQDRREAAVLQLQKLGAAQNAIKVTEATLAAGESDAERQMQRMMLQQMRAQGRTVKRGQPPKSVTVSSTLIAEWPLAAKTNEELLVFAEKLQSDITAADLAGLNEPKKLTPEEEELQEEMADMMEQYSYSENQPKPGTPAFAYVARITDAERQQALATAFEKAKTQAQQLAVAAKAKLGKLSSLSGTTSQANEDYNYAQRMFAMQYAMAQATAGEAGSEEALVPHPGAATFQVLVTATFQLE